MAAPGTKRSARRGRAGFATVIVFSCAEALDGSLHSRCDGRLSKPRTPSSRMWLSSTGLLTLRRAEELDIWPGSTYFCVFTVNTGLPSRPTIKDVARAANVSQATVSYILNNSSAAQRISEGTKRRVWAETERLGYRFNPVGHAFIGHAHARHVGPPALLDRLVGDVLFDRADRDRAEAVIERAGAFAQPVLRADAAAHFRQRVGAMGQLGRFEQLALADQVQPVRAVVVNRAFPLTERIAAGQAAAGLLRGHFRFVARIDLVEHLDALGDLDLLGLAAREFQELQGLIDHLKPRGADARSANRSRRPWAS